MILYNCRGFFFYVIQMLWEKWCKKQENKYYVNELGYCLLYLKVIKNNDMRYKHILKDY
jgi:hypothetical protein